MDCPAERISGPRLIFRVLAIPCRFLSIALTRSQSILFDHLVGEREQLRRNVEAERLGGLKIDRQLELG
jgi:hypothetical protein